MALTGECSASQMPRSRRSYRVAQHGASRCNHYHDSNAYSKHVPSNSKAQGRNIYVRVCMRSPKPAKVLCSSPNDICMHPLQMIMHFILPWECLSSHLTPLAPLHWAPKSRFRSHSRVFCHMMASELNDAAERLVEAPGRETFEMILARVAVAEECAYGDVARRRW
jgi:hypothetical protein